MEPSYIPKAMKLLRPARNAGLLVLLLLGFGYVEYQPELNPALELATDSEPSFLREAVVAPRNNTNARTRLSTISHTIARGETLSEIWKRFGSDPSLALKAEAALKDAGDNLHLLKAGEELKLRLEKNGTIRSLSRALQDGRSLVLRLTRKGDYSTVLRQPEILTEEKTVSGVVSSSLADSASELGLSFSLVDQMVDLFGSKVEFTRDLQPGDTFVLRYREKVLKNGQVINEPQLLHAAMWLSGQTYVALSDTSQDGKLHFYDQNGDPLGNYFLRYPVKFSRISSTFSDSRLHPVLKIKRPHLGVDFAAPVGTEVRAVADGVILRASYDSASGNMVKIRHDYRYSTAYLHLSRIAKGLRTGTRISRGQVIGGVGMSGLATGPHLHFGLYDRGRYVDPLRTALPVLSTQEQKLPKAKIMLAMALLNGEHERLQLALAYRSDSQAAS